MLTVNRLSKRLGEFQVLTQVSFTVNRGDRIGLVGPNGAGKSTLLALLSGRMKSDSGTISMDPESRVGYLRQGFADLEQGTLGDLLDELLGGLLSAAHQVDAATSALSSENVELQSALDDFSLATEKFEIAGGYARIDQLTTLLARFGFTEVTFETPLRQLSGGEKTRAGLAGLLASEPDLLLLDEPTNHLDIHALTWLESFVASYRGAVVVVSHDRSFLDEVATRILELDDATRTVTSYSGNYSDYVETKSAEADAYLDAFQRQQRYIERVERDIRSVASYGQKTESGTTNDGERRRAKKVAKTSKVRERKLEKLIDSADHMEKPERRWGLSLDLNSIAESGRDVVIAHDLTFAFGNRILLDSVDLHIRSGERVALTGSNGAGKSTLIRLITGDLLPTSGSIRLGASVTPGVYAQEQENVDPARSALDQVREAASGEESEARAFLHKFLFTEDHVRRPAGELSYGERARLSLALLVRRGANVLLLDEPLNHLDLQSRERFEDALLGFEGTILIVLHDRFAIDRIATRVLNLENAKLSELLI